MIKRLFKKNEGTFRVALIDGQRKRRVDFEASADRTILQAAEDAGLDYPHSCRAGTCRACRTILVDGRVKELTDFAFVLDERELARGMILACQSRPTSDITIENDTSFRLTDRKKAAP